MVLSTLVVQVLDDVLGTSTIGYQAKSALFTQVPNSTPGPDPGTGIVEVTGKAKTTTTVQVPDALLVPGITYGTQFTHGTDTKCCTRHIGSRYQSQSEVQCTWRGTWPPLWPPTGAAPTQRGRCSRGQWWGRTQASSGTTE